jgi:hypothetical protein
MDNKEIKRLFTYMEANRKYMTQYQSDFMKSLKKYYTWKGTLTPKQVECLLNIKENMQVESKV